MRKFLAGIAVAALAATAAGCGSEDASAESGSVEDVVNAEDHDALVALAEAEGSLKVSTSMTEESIPLIKDAFEARYPGIELDISEQSGDDDKRILLELQAETNDIDVLHISGESYHDYLPYVAEVDILQLVQDGVLDIPEGMINPAEPGTVATASAISGFAWNPDNLPAEEVPTSWEDFLAPELSGRKFLVDIEPANLAVLGVAWGEEKLLEYVSQIREQEPIWVRGDTNSLTLMSAGEYALHAFSNYHSAYRVTLNSDNIEIGLVEPIPVRIDGIVGVSKVSAHPAAATLFIEFLAGADAQHILDENEPVQSSIYAPGSVLNELTEGKEVSVLSWDTFDDVRAWESNIVEAWGFPNAEVEEE